MCPEGHILLSKEIWVYPLVGMRNGHPWWFRQASPTSPLGASKLFNLLRRLVVKAIIYLTAPLTYSYLHQYLSWCSSLMSGQIVFFLRFIFLCPKGQKTEMIVFVQNTTLFTQTTKYKKQLLGRTLIKIIMIDTGVV